ncbi:hypothetical protein JCM8208_003009 [Rhodotorula glutinis]
MQASVATSTTTLPPSYLHHHHHHLPSSSQLTRPHSPAQSRPHSPVPPHLQGRTTPQQHHPHSRQQHRSTPPSHGTTSARPPRSTRQDRDRDGHHHHHQPRYDPDYDRAAASRSAASLAGHPASSSSRELFNPISHHHHHHQQARRPASPALAPPLDPPPRPRREHRERPDRGDRPDRDDARPRTRSKREPVDPADLGRRAGAGSGSGLVAARSGAGHAHHHSSRATVAQGSKESLESVETDFSGRTRSSGGGGGASGGRRRRRREEAGGDEGDEAADSVAAGLGSVAGASSASRSSRQLFDPRRDDPMRFAEARAERTAGRHPHGALVKGPAADTRSLASGSVLSFASDMTGDDAASASASAASGAPSASGSKRPPHPAMAPLKRAYREITDLEARVTDEHRAAQAAASAREGGEADEFASGGGGGGGGLGGAKAGVRIQGAGAGGRARLDDEFWVRLATLHKQLADAHYSFLQLALDPRLPASLHSLAQRYNIPTRLWQVGFHQLLERMRHAVLSAPLPSSTSTSTSSHAHAHDSPPANVLEHLIEFIQHAYGFYSQLFEDPTIAVFRAAWIEQLGDLARYRMAVAGLASRMHAASSASAAPARLTSAALDANAKATQQQQQQQQQRPADAASIGQAALNDWDLEEHETWREMARDWYGQGLAENPGTGRLQHHLALLSKGDELRALYHYAKSLTATHPYLSARESILPLFEDEHQQRRTQPDVTKAELFVHLHGMLFTKISLDDFSPAEERFLERLQEERWALLKSRDEWRALSVDHKGDQAPFGDREWFMLGVVNVASLLQYGADDGVLKKLLARDSASGDGAEDGSASAAHHGPGHGDGGHLSARGSRHGRGGGGGGAGGSSRHGSSATLASASAARAAPQAIMVKRSDADDAAALDDERTAHGGGSSSAASTVGPATGLGGADDLVKQLGNGPSGASTLPEDDPLPFKLAQELSFSLLSFLIDTPFRILPSSTLALPNPYVTLVLTFVAHLSHHPSALAHLERAIPWAHLAALFNRLPSTVDVRLDAQTKLSAGRPLPEDWCLRGMDWAGRQLFARGYWREHRPRAPTSPSGDVGGLSGEGGAGARVESEMDALRFDMAALDEGEGAGGGGASSANDEAGTGPSAAARLAEARWRRLAICAAWLVRNVPGFDYDARAVDPSRRFRISGALQRKLERWQREEDDAREAERLSRLALDERGSASAGSAEEEDEESAGEDDDDENDSEAVRELKSRRRQLKAIIRSARSATRGPKLGGRLAARLGGKAASIPKVFAGYTVLVFDTNILLTSIDLFSELVAAECWTIIVPLAVVTELDGLRRNPTALGVAAAEVIEYLELAVRGYSRFLKIQTSRGNYLKDLAIRNESIDFGSSSPAASSSLDGTASFSSSHDVARSMDDVILRAVAWQRDHFSNRLALVNPQAVLDKRRVPADTAQVVLVTFDRNLRLKAGARGLDATDEKGLKKAVAAAAGFG